MRRGMLFVTASSIELWRCHVVEPSQDVGTGAKPQPRKSSASAATSCSDPEPRGSDSADRSLQEDAEYAEECFL